MRRSLPELIDALARGGPVDGQDRERRTPLFYAAQEGDIALVEALLSRGADPNARDANGETPLHFAARDYQPMAARRLIDSGAEPDASDSNGATPLWRAVFASEGRGQMIELLLSAGADKKRKNAHGVSPSDLADSIANHDVARYLR